MASTNPTTGTINGHYFDPLIFAEVMQEKSYLKNALIQSGVVVHSDLINQHLGAEGLTCAIPVYKNIDDEEEALNFDGVQDNVPTELDGKLQTVMVMSRMKSWTETDFKKYVLGKSPLENLANRLLHPYWVAQRERDLLHVIKGALKVTGLRETHVTDLTAGKEVVDATTKLSLTSHVTLGQKALGDLRSAFKLFVCHSVVATNLKNLGITSNLIYTNDVTKEEVTLTTLGDMILLETDTNTVDTSGSLPKYHSYMLAHGQILTTDRPVPCAYGIQRDELKHGGLSVLFSKQAYVYHPNGLSFKPQNIARKSPTAEELENGANWELVLNAKGIGIAEIISFG